VGQKSSTPAPKRPRPTAPIGQSVVKAKAESKKPRTEAEDIGRRAEDIDIDYDDDDDYDIADVTGSGLQPRKCL
jgi:hypothetical protein